MQVPEARLLSSNVFLVTLYAILFSFFQSKVVFLFQYRELSFAGSPENV